MKMPPAAGRAFKSLNLSNLITILKKIVEFCELCLPQTRIERTCEPVADLNASGSTVDHRHFERQRAGWCWTRSLARLNAFASMMVEPSTLCATVCRVAQPAGTE